MYPRFKEEVDNGFHVQRNYSGYVGAQSTVHYLGTKKRNTMARKIQDDWLYLMLQYHTTDPGNWEVPTRWCSMDLTLVLSPRRAGVLKLLVLWSPWRDWPYFTEPHNKFLKIKTKKHIGTRSHEVSLAEPWGSVRRTLRTYDLEGCHTKANGFPPSRIYMGADMG